jgi:hypothetical protein
MEDKKGPGPKKKVVIRKSVETRDASVPENPKESPAPEKTETDWKLSWSPEEMKQKSLIASGATQGKEYTSVDKKLTPLTPEEQKEGKVNLNKLVGEDKGYYLRKVLSYKGEAPTNEALEGIDNLAIIADKSGVTSPAQIKSLFEGDFKEKRLKEAGLTEEQFNRLGGKDKQDLYYSVLQQVNAKRKKLEDLKAIRSSVVVEPTQKAPAPETKVVEDGIDKAVRLVKDEKTGVVRKQMKDSR